MITVRLAKIGVKSLNQDIKLQVVWKRGPEKQSSNEVDLNEYEIDTEMNDVMSKVSSFYTKDQVTFQPKLCNFIIVRPETEKEIASIEVNMAKFVGKNQAHQHLDVTCSDEMYNGLFLEVIWTIMETSEKAPNMSVVGGVDF